MTFNLTGATRLNVIVGDPIAQVKSPAGMTAAFAARGYDGILVPVQVGVSDLQDFLNVADRLKNLDSIIVTVPHKFTCYRHCASATPRSTFIGSANLMRRLADGRWYGDITDGFGFVQATRNHGFDPKGKRALLVGVGGAGSAIAYELADSGVAELALHDADTARRDDLVARLNSLGKAKVVAGSSDPTGYDLVGNATPAGMRAGDPLPIQADKLQPNQFVGCVITQPAVTPLIASARAKGCATSTGTDMYQALQGAMVDFLLAAEVWTPKEG
jgi:shikimate dehydrogenase